MVNPPINQKNRKMKKIEFEMPSYEELIEKLNELEKKLDLLTKPKQLDPILTPKKLAEALDKSIRTLQSWREPGKEAIIYSQYGSSVWYTAENVLKFLMEHEFGSTNDGGPSHE